MKIAFLSSFFPHTTEISEGNAALYRILERNNETNLFNFSLLYPEILFPELQEISNNKVADNVQSQQLLNSVNPASYYSTASAIKDFNPDLFLSRYWMPFLGLSLGSVAKFIRKSIIYKKRNTKFIGLIDNMQAPNPQLLESKNNSLYVKNHDAFITFSSEATADLLAINPSALFIEHPFPIYSYIATKTDKITARKTLGIPPNKKVMLYFDEIREYKGIDLLIKTIANLPDEYHLILVGEAKTSFDYFQRMIDEHNVKDKISSFVRKINENEVHVFYSATDVVIQPSKEQPKRNVISSALNYNIPIISNDTANANKLIETNKLGIVIQDMSVENLSSEINNYFEKNLQNTIAESIQKFKHFASWESVAATIYYLYDVLIGKEKNIMY
ncbi:MAG: glycosyltransferase [Ignavibacteria bacterium]|jgi:glycosyltransferase involved in cell wall biosynthesis|nr:glycosyltransferase [Ignavibacteria bacterium]